MHDLLAMPFTLMADASAAGIVIDAYITPLMRVLCTLAVVACMAFLVNGGYLYITASGSPGKAENAKRVLKNALLGLLIVLAAATINEMLTHAYNSATMTNNATLPQLQAMPPQEASSGLDTIIINGITGFLKNIIQSVAQPFLDALSFFTKSTELMTSNSAVLNMWRIMVIICDGLFILIMALLGLHIMSATSFGFDEVDVRHLFPRLALIFLGMNASIFIIDGFIGVSNFMIMAINAAVGGTSVWSTLSGVVDQSGGQGAAALLLMVAFVIFSVILLVYYVGRLVTLYIGAVLAPAVLLTWLMPGFRDFAETAFKTYITTIFVLFVHVVILQLAASLFAGMASGAGNNAPDTLMAMVTGLATVLALLKTQGVMSQFSYVSMGTRNAKKMTGQFINGINSLTSRRKSAAASRTDDAQKARAIARIEKKAIRTGTTQSVSYKTKAGTDITHTARPDPRIAAKPTVKVTRVAAPAKTTKSRDKKS